MNLYWWNSHIYRSILFAFHWFYLLFSKVIFNDFLMVLATQILKQTKGHYSPTCKTCYIYKRSRATEVLFVLDINKLWNSKYLFRELGIAWKWSDKLSVHLLFYKHNFPKAAALCNISWTIIYKNVCSFIWQSLPGVNSGNIINGLQHFIMYMGACFSTGKLSVSI